MICIKRCFFSIILDDMSWRTLIWDLERRKHQQRSALSFRWHIIKNLWSEIWQEEFKHQQRSALLVSDDLSSKTLIWDLRRKNHQQRSALSLRWLIIKDLDMRSEKKKPTTLTSALPQMTYHQRPWYEIWEEETINKDLL